MAAYFFFYRVEAFARLCGLGVQHYVFGEVEPAYIFCVFHDYGLTVGLTDKTVHLGMPCLAVDYYLRMVSRDI